MTLLIPSLTYSGQVDGVSVNLESQTWDPTLDGVGMSPQRWAPITNTQPIDEPKIVRAGFMGAGPNSTFYNRILVEPAILALGNLLSAQSRTVRVWNGYLDDRNLTDLQITGGDGITIQQPVAIPHTMAGLEELEYIVNITLEGPAVIDADLVWTIDGGQYTAQITGSRVVVFPFPPNWKLAQFVETLEWKTDVMRAFSGAEQRRSVRTKARRSFNYTMSKAGPDSARLDNILWGWQNRMFSMPVWSDKAHTLQRNVVGDTTIEIDTTALSFVAGGLAIFYSTETVFEVVEIDQVLSNALVLLRPLQNDWEQDSLVMPAVLAHLGDSINVTRHTSNVVSAPLTFTCDPSNTDPYTPDAAPAVTYQGLEVLMRQPNWSGNSLQNTQEYAFNVMDSGYGAIRWDQTEEFPRTTRAYSWLLRDRAQVLAFRQMLGRLRGKAKTLWVPTWHQDFVVTQEIGAADTFIVVNDNGFRLLVGVDPTRNHLMLRLRDGTNLFAQIVSVSDFEGKTALGINTPFNRPITMAEVHSLHLMMLSRLATDQVDITWVKNTAATVDTSFMTVKA